MADLLRTGLSGLKAFQRALDTTSHNIANVNTVGYSRQRVEVGTRPADPYGNGWVGNGSSVQTIRRVYDEYVAQQTRTTSSGLERMDVFASNAERVNNMFGDSEAGLTASLQKFTNAFQGVANAPASIPARQVLLSEANALKDQLQYFDSRLSDMDTEVNSSLKGQVSEINAIAQGIAKLNRDISTGMARAGGQPPNDLLDQRDQLIDQLSEKVSVSAVKQDGGQINVFIGNGQPVVLGAVASELTTIQDNFDPSRLSLALKTQSGVVDITSNISGGSLGGVLDFRREMLDPAHNALGRFSVGLADTVNAQNAKGIDLSGVLGGDFFAVGDVEVLPNKLNGVPGATLAVARGSVGNLTEKDYNLELTGGGWRLRDANNGTTVTMTGSGTALDPFVADGMELVVSGTANVGDEFLVRPTRSAVSDMSVLVTDPAKVAAAAPIRSAVNAANTGTGTISAGSVLDGTNAQLRNPVTIQFLTTSTYSINGAGSFTYTAGSNIDVNGWRTQISGSPAVGDRFTMVDNTSGSGDNRNALLLADALKRPVLDGGTTSLSDGVSKFVSGIGVSTRQAQVSRDAQAAVHAENEATMDGISGVNLDEEAANLLKYQQAYQAAAQVIRMADTLFQTLLTATGR
jgi:flagellar hook-associated protein 1 FlgK